MRENNFEHDCSSTRRKKEGEECIKILDMQEGEGLSDRRCNFRGKGIAKEDKRTSQGSHSLQECIHG